ncbi:hypothetical protein [Alicyclobacillus macrosporangiidus]|uniref:hypothetical protein n=1 Tax=Alicyclobacillus macrosporangiidus TaxID=392015 RepID=UPI00049710C1|nr:hypothetical protein [Alicyclobacillus macrosporangiidus]
MNDFDEELRRRLRALPELPFTPELADRIQRAARAPRQRRRARRWSSWLVGGCGVAAAVMMTWLVWSGMEVGTASPGRIDRTLAASNAVPQGSSIGLVAAPLSVGYIGVTGTGSGRRDTVTATLTNVGTQPLSADDVFGVLSFQEGEDGELLSSTRWITLVDAPDTPIQPGQTVTWTFRPIGAPADANGNLTLTPRLVFFKKGLVPAAQADVVWQVPGAEVQRVRVQSTSEWPNGESFQVEAELVNTGKLPLSLHNLLAVIWFTPRGHAMDWTAPNPVRFMAQVEPDPASDRVLAPGASAQVVFRLIGPPADYTSMDPHIQWILR